MRMAIEGEIEIPLRPDDITSHQLLESAGTGRDKGLARPPVPCGKGKEAENQLYPGQDGDQGR